MAYNEPKECSLPGARKPLRIATSGNTGSSFMNKKTDRGPYGVGTKPTGQNPGSIGGGKKIGGAGTMTKNPKGLGGKMGFAGKAGKVRDRDRDSM